EPAARTADHQPRPKRQQRCQVDQRLLALNASAKNDPEHEAQRHLHEKGEVVLVDELTKAGASNEQRQTEAFAMLRRLPNDAKNDAGDSDAYNRIDQNPQPLL